MGLRIGVLLALILAGCVTVPGPTSGPSRSSERTTNPRADWSYHVILPGDDTNDTGINGIVEFRGRLYAWGRASLEPGIWVSEDAVTWTATEIPPTGGSDNSYANDVYGLAELRGHLYAWGTVGWGMPAIWVSDDGNRWRATELPDPQIEDATIVDIVETSDRLVAVAVGGDELIDDVSNRPTMTMIYTSSDGESWQAVDDTPGIDAGAHGIVLQVAGKLLAVGGPLWIPWGRLGGADDTWVSDDGGLSWSVSTTAGELDGWMTSAAENDGLIVGIGHQTARGRTWSGPALVWTSSDGGISWARRELSADAVASKVLFGPDGRIVITGIGASPSIWTSDDRGESWDETTPPLSQGPDGYAHTLTSNVTVMPGGYAATVYVQSPPPDGGGPVGLWPRDAFEGIIWTSPDAITWTEHEIDLRPSYITWTPTYGVVVLGIVYNDHLVALGPEPFP